MSEKVRDLRSALKLLSEIPGQLAETDVEVEPMAELSGVYRYVGAGGTVKRPTKEGPAMIFNSVDLPVPLMPMIPTFSPSCRKNDVSSNSCRRLYDFDKCSMESKFIAILISAAVILVSFL